MLWTEVRLPPGPAGNLSLLTSSSLRLPRTVVFYLIKPDVNQSVGDIYPTRI